MCTVFFSNNSFLFRFHISSTWTYPGGIELREALIQKNDKSLEINSSSNIAAKKEEGSCDMKVPITQNSKSSIECETCSDKDDGNQFTSCKDQVNCKSLTNAGDVKQDNDTTMTKSPSTNLRSMEKSPDNASQKISDSNQALQHLHMVSDDKEKSTIDEHEITKTSPTNASQSISTPSTTKVNATTETPPAQLVVTFSTDTIGLNHSGDHRNHSKHSQPKYECSNHVIEENNGSIEERKNSCEGSYSCSCDDSCFNGGSILSQEKLTSNLDSGKTTPHSNGNAISIHTTFGKNGNKDDNNALQNIPNAVTKKRKVSIATQTASISASLCSSVGSPGSSDEQQSLKSTNHERTLSSVIGEHNIGLSNTSNNTQYQINSSSKYRLEDEPLSLMQEVPDVSL